MLDVVDLTLALCAIPSITGDEAAIADDVALRLHKLGARVARQQVGATTGRDNLLVTVGTRAPELLLTTHLDTVPPFIAPTSDGTTLWGRGVLDAKGIAAAMMVAFEQLLAQGEERVALLFVVGEETDSDGAKAAVDAGFVPHVRYFIDGEPTDGKLVRATKGVMAFELSATGKPAHSAYPHAGHSAVHQLLDDLARLRAELWHDDPNLGPTTLNVGLLKGGVAPNVLAPSADAVCVMRTTTDAQQLEQRIRTLLSPTTQMKVRTQSSPQHLTTVPGEDTCVVAFGSDVPHLTPIGAPLLVGPGSILDAHTAHEHVTIADLHHAVAYYQRLAQTLLHAPRS